MATPQYNLVGELTARRLEWTGRVLNGSEDALPRVEILRLALAARIVEGPTQNAKTRRSSRRKRRHIDTGTGNPIKKKT